MVRKRWGGSAETLVVLTGVGAIKEGLWKQ